MAHVINSGSKSRTVLRVIGGNFLEMFDFMVYGFYAAYVAKALFPPGDADFALLMSWVTFGIGFLMRPLGAIVLGAYTDKHGRRAGLILSLSIMAAGVVMIACVPSYATVGVAAPAIVILGRLLQGFSAGAESGAVSVYLSEIAPKGRKNLFVSFQVCSQQVAVIFAAVIGICLRFALTDGQMQEWGWRIPFIIGTMLVPLILVMRRSLEETPAFIARRSRPSLTEIYRTLFVNWRIVGTAILMITLTAVMFYLITAYVPTYGKQVLKLDAIDGFIVTVAIGFTNVLWMPVAAYLADRTGHMPILILSCLGIALFSYPLFLWLVSAPSLWRLLTVEVMLGTLYSFWQGVLVGALVTMMPSNVRTAGWSLAYSITYAIFGGFTPALVTFMIHATGNKAIPGITLTIAALIGLAGTLLARRYLGDTGEDKDRVLRPDVVADMTVAQSPPVNTAKPSLQA